MVRDKKDPFILSLTGVCLIWTLTNLTFSHRIFIYLDICLIIFGGYGLSKLNFKKLWVKALFAAIILTLGYQTTTYIQSLPPLIKASELQEIQNFHTKTPGQFVVSTTANDAPWLLGFATDIRLAAPGLFEDRFTYQEWENFWHGIDQTRLLWKYPRPMYIYQRLYPLYGQIQTCMKPVSQNFFEYTCP